jgi:hypothetical protein
MVFRMPEATIRLIHNPKEITSVTRLPSRKLNTTPHTIPSGSPLKKRNTKLNGKGTRANPKRATSAKRISQKIRRMRWEAFNSEMTLIPKNFEIIYPATWDMIKTVLYPIPHNSYASYKPVLKGLRKAYIQK